MRISCSVCSRTICFRCSHTKMCSSYSATLYIYANASCFNMFTINYSIFSGKGQQAPVMEMAANAATARKQNVWNSKWFVIYYQFLFLKQTCFNFTSKQIAPCRYCNCFASGYYCSETCSCQGCFNTPEYQDKVLQTRRQIVKIVKILTELVKIIKK